MIIALQTLVFFRESLLALLGHLLSPYYQTLSLVFIGREDEEVEDEEDEVFAEFDEEKGVVFFPPMYSQRYAAVSDCLMDERWAGKLEKVVDLGYHDMSFIKYLKDMPGVRCILGVDVESIPLRCSASLLSCEEHTPMEPLQITLFQGNAADPDYRLIGCDAVIAIEMIEHMLPHDLDRLVHNIFGFIKPWIAVITTPNADFNVLFKNMEKNGLRRMDHLFEWSREQFYDWCTNIVTRYPQFSVLCQGIGPGPLGTQHLGCCSQLALFVNKTYIKQRDLDLNSLALVAKVPSPQNFKDMIGDWEYPLLFPDARSSPTMNNSVVSQNNILYSPEQSCLTIVISPSYSMDELEYRDSTSQCNLDREVGRNYLMFDHEEPTQVLVPRRILDQKVYIIEDVFSRLNCSTFQVKRFSKTTQDLMEKYKVDTLVHTREVVNEIRHLTKMLNFNKPSVTELQEKEHIWCNINWGDNAPYWNQYYKVVKEYHYPFEARTDDGRIVDLISEEINRLIDTHCDEEFSTEVNKLEIPIEHLMRVLRHITTDVDQVKDLLEWNGYEVVDDMVIHSRLVVDTNSMDSREDEWRDNDTTFDWETDVHSTSFSDASAIVPDYQGRCLRKALDKKLRTLRSLMCGEEDVTSELDRVVCRLMKLALWTSRGKQQPPPSRWMQCKLLDLLTLTEKAVTRRKKFFNDCFPEKPMELDYVSGRNDLAKFKDDTVVRHIEARYREFCSSPEYSDHAIEHAEDAFDNSSKDLWEEMLSYESNEHIEEGGNINRLSSDLKRTHDWIEERSVLEEVAYPNKEETAKMNSTDRDFYSCNRKRFKQSKKLCASTAYNDFSLDIKPNTCFIKVIENKNVDINIQKNYKNTNKHEAPHTNSRTKLEKKKSKSFSKNSKNKDGCANYERQHNTRKIKEHKKLQSTASKPIPGSIIELCHPDLTTQNNMEETIKWSNKRNRPESNVAEAKESLLIGIVSDGMEETIALRKSIGTDADEEQMVLERETLLSSVLNTHGVESLDKADDVHSQPIFLYDINEPSTSKGVRHKSMDAQCGPDADTPAYVMLSPAASVARMPSMVETGIKIGNSFTDLSVRKCLGTSTEIENFGPVCRRIKSPNIFHKGIKIGDSDTDLNEKAEKDVFDLNTVTTVEEYEHGTVFIMPKFPKTGIVIRDTSSNEGPFRASFIKENKTIDHDEAKREGGAEVLCNETKEYSYRHSHLTENEGSEDGSSYMRYRRRKLSTIPGFTEGTTEGFTFKDSDIYSADQTSALMEKKYQPKSTCFLKLIPSPVEPGDSGSDFCGSFGSPKSPVHFIAESESTKTSNKDTSLKLSYGGVHTHSYKDKEVLEDVIYQGQWQRGNGKTRSRKKCISTISRRSIEIITRRKKDPPKEKTQLKKNDLKVVNIEPRNKLSIKYIRDTKTKPRPVDVKPQPPTKQTRNNNSTMIGNGNKTVKQKKTIVKVPSKTTMSSTTPKMFKYISKNANAMSPPPRRQRWTPAGQIKVNVVAVKKSTEKIENKILNKNYIPSYLRRQKAINNKYGVNTSFESSKTITKKSKCRLDEQTTEDLQKSDETIVKKEDTIVTKEFSDPKVQEIIKKTIDKPPKNLDSIENTDTNNHVKKKTCSPVSKPNTTKSFIKSPISVVMEATKFSETKSMQKQTKLLNKAESRAIKKDLLKFNVQQRDASYFVFRNELENKVKSSTTCNAESPRESAKKKPGNRRQSSSPISLSSCSSPDSVATVKVVPPRSRRHSASSNKSSLANTESEPMTPARSRKYTKRVKNKKSDHKDCNNKENLPESSEKDAAKDSIKKEKNAFKSIGKNVCMAMSAETSTMVNSLSKHQTATKSDVKIPAAKSPETKWLKGSIFPKVSAKKSLKSDDSSCNEEFLINNIDSSSSEISDVVLLIDSRHQGQCIENTAPQSTESMKFDSSTNMRDQKITIQPLDDPQKSTTGSVHSTISSSMKRLIEGRLDFITSPSVETKVINEEAEYPVIPTDDETLVLNDINDSAETEDWSYTSVMAAESFNNWIEKTPEPNDFDVLSFKSFTSESRFSEYFLADNEFQNTLISEPPAVVSPVVSPAPVATPRAGSVRGLFERKEPIMSPNPVSGLAVQAFSGFSMNADPVSGDQPDKPDYVNLMDSETGSLAADYQARQAASEELLVSGRSSASYESCLIDEDAVVPNWLFEIIQQQQQELAAESANTEPSQFVVPMPLPVVAPDLEVNGNTLEPGVGVGAGAGDGRGIHSDHSQDSSGRGTSLSSTDTSSGQTSEAILIEPSPLVAQFELIHDSIGSGHRVPALVVPGEVPAVSFRTPDSPPENQVMGTSRSEAMRNRLQLVASDADADVSSLDTDVPDSS